MRLRGLGSDGLGGRRGPLSKQTSRVCCVGRFPLGRHDGRVGGRGCLCSWRGCFVLDKLMQGLVMFARRDSDWTINVNGWREQSRRSSAYSRCAKECVEALSYAFVLILP